MKRSKTIIIVITLLWILIAAAVGISLRNFPFSVLIRSDGSETELFCNQTDETYCVFLPSYAENAEVVICADTFFGVTIDGVRLSDEMDVTQFPLDTPLELTFYSYDGIHRTQITFVQSANVNTLYLDVPERDVEYVHETKGNATSGTACMYTADGQLLYDGGLEELKGRGNYTWTLAKKPYNITLSSDADLLGTGSADRWVLLANAMDPTHLRNKIAYTFASDFGLAYSPACDWVDLYINGTYRGLYLLTERNEIHSERINIDEENSFLVSTELEPRMWAESLPYHCSAGSNIFRIRYNTLPEGEMEYVLQCVENAILAEDGLDYWTQKSYTELIDMDSWARKYLMEEIFGNYDGGSVSQFFYYEQSDGKVYAGPIWDMDNAMGISAWAGAANSLLAGRPHMWNYEDHPLFYALMQKEDFYETVLRLYQEEMLPLLEQYCAQDIPAYSQRIQQAVRLDQLLWEPGTELTEIVTYLQNRMDFWNRRWFSGETFYTVQALYPNRIMLALEVAEGTSVSSLPDGGENWYLAGTGEPYDITLPIYQDLALECVLGQKTEG